MKKSVFYPVLIIFFILVVIGFIFLLRGLAYGGPAEIPPILVLQEELKSNIDNVASEFNSERTLEYRIYDDVKQICFHNGSIVVELHSDRNETLIIDSSIVVEEEFCQSDYIQLDLRGERAKVIISPME